MKRHVEDDTLNIMNEISISIILRIAINENSKKSIHLMIIESFYDIMQSIKEARMNSIVISKFYFLQNQIYSNDKNNMNHYFLNLLE